MAKHRKQSAAKKNIKRAATVTTTGAFLAMSATPAMAEPTVEHNFHLNLPVLELPAAPAAPVVSTVTGDMVVAEARTHIGKNYVWGGESDAEGGYDCSGLVHRVFADLGISVPRTSGALAGIGTAVPSLDQALPGDILAWPGHVAIYSGSGMMVEASQPGTQLHERNVWGSPMIRRVLTGAEIAPEPAPAPVVPADDTPTEEIIVQTGDTLSKIASTIGTSWQDVYEDNATVIGSNPNLIYPGQVFFVGGLPLTQPPVTVVEAGSSLVPGSYLSSEFGPRAWDNAFHHGIDLAAEQGTPIYAPVSGTVDVSGLRDPDGFGAVVYMTTDDGEELRFGHIAAWMVGPGDRVVAGQQIATVGSRGQSTGPHLHFEVRIGPGPINPKTWLADRGISLN